MANEGKTTNELADWHQKVLRNFDKAYAGSQSMREQVVEAQRFVRVAGAQWEGSTNAGYSFEEGRFEHYPRFELNKIARECDRIIGEYRQNRISVKFRPKDNQASEALAEKMNGKFRADYQETSGGEACDNAFDEAVVGGFGCFRMCADNEDEMDPSNEQRRISLVPIYDPATKGIKIEGAKRGVEISCVPLTPGAYPYNTQVAEIQIDFVQQWMNGATESVYINGAGQNRVEFFAWDYDGYQIKPTKIVSVNGIDGRDNFVSGNVELEYVYLESPQNAYNSLYRTFEYKSSLHRRTCAIKHVGSGVFEIERGYHIPIGVKGISVSPTDPFALIIEYDPGFTDEMNPYIICQDTNNAKGYSLKPFYNQGKSSEGKAWFYITKPGGTSVSPLSEIPVGAIFFIEIICV